MLIGLNPADRLYPLSDGEVLFTIKKEARNNGGMIPTEFTFELCFGEGEVIEGEPLIQSLQKLMDLTIGIVEKFTSVLA